MLRNGRVNILEVAPRKDGLINRSSLPLDFTTFSLILYIMPNTLPTGVHWTEYSVEN